MSWHTDLLIEVKPLKSQHVSWAAPFQKQIIQIVEFYAFKKRYMIDSYVYLLKTTETTDIFGISPNMQFDSNFICKKRPQGFSFV